MRRRRSRRYWIAYSRSSRSWRRLAAWSNGASRGAACGCAASCPTAGPMPTARRPGPTVSCSRILPERGGLAFLPRRDNRLPAELLAHAPAAGLGESRGECGVGRNALDRLGDRGRILRPDEQTRLAVRDDVGDPADRAANDRDPIAQRLE